MTVAELKKELENVDDKGVVTIMFENGDYTCNVDQYSNMPVRLDDADEDRIYPEFIVLSAGKRINFMESEDKWDGTCDHVHDDTCSTPCSHICSPNE